MQYTKIFVKCVVQNYENKFLTNGKICLLRMVDEKQEFSFNVSRFCDCTKNFLQIRIFHLTEILKKIRCRGQKEIIPQV